MKTFDVDSGVHSAVSVRHQKPLPPSRFAPRGVLVLYSVLYGIAMMIMGGTDFTHLYAPSPYHRLQADAILQGHLYLGDSIEQMRHDLVWHAGYIQHVWGLGVGMWLTPFEFLWRLCGLTWFPDRVALGVAFSLLAAYSGSTAWRLGSVSKRIALGIGFVWLITLCPTIWALNQEGRPVYEETSLYATLVSLGILTAVVRICCFGTRRDFIICVLLSALSTLVRPTHGIYGLGGMLVCSVVMLKRRGLLKTVLAGNAVFVLGLATVLVTNWLRFGSPTEFGHRLTITGKAVVYMTRFDNPMREASVIEAGKELFGWLFLNHKLRYRQNEDEPSVPGQSPYARWRDPYMTTFDPGWAIVSLAGFIGGVFWLRRKRRLGSGLHWLCRRPGSALILGIFSWALLGAGALLTFYPK